MRNSRPYSPDYSCFSLIRFFSRQHAMLFAVWFLLRISTYFSAATAWKASRNRPLQPLFEGPRHLLSVVYFFANGRSFPHFPTYLSASLTGKAADTTRARSSVQWPSLPFCISPFFVLLGERAETISGHSDLPHGHARATLCVKVTFFTISKAFPFLQ